MDPAWTMSDPLRKAFSDLFGSPTYADCIIRFIVHDSVGEGAVGAASVPRDVCQPFPAHQLILRCGSDRFQAQLDRWQKPEQDQPAAKCARTSVVATPAGGARTQQPEVVILLDCDSQLEPSKAALSYLYSNKLPPEATASVQQLLGVRRQAGYLEVAGCVQACDMELSAIFESAQRNYCPPTASGAERLFPSKLLPALDLYACRDMVYLCEGEPGIRRVLASALSYVVRCMEEPDPDPSVGPSKGDLLAWLLGGDAVTLMNSQEHAQKLNRLTMSAMEALLQSSSFGTDDESTVLLVLEAWASVRGMPAAWRDSVRRLVRLANTNESYLTDVVPFLPWVQRTIKSDELLFMARYAAADDDLRERLAEMYGFRYNLGLPRYGSPRPPYSPPDGGLRIEWEVSQVSLAIALSATAGGAAITPGRGSSGGGGGGEARKTIRSNRCIISRGYEWRVVLRHTPGDADAGVHVECKVPGALALESGRASAEGGAASCPPLRLEVHRWSCTEDGRYGRALPYVLETQDEKLVMVGGCWGRRTALGLRAVPQVEPLARAQVAPEVLPAAGAAGDMERHGGAAAAAAVTPGQGHGRVEGGGAGGEDELVQVSILDDDGQEGVYVVRKGAVVQGAAPGGGGGGGGAAAGGGGTWGMLEAWREYLGPNGKITGTLTFLAL